MPISSSRPLHTAQELFTKALDRHNPGPQPRPQEHPAWHSRFNPLNRIKRCLAESREPEPIYAIQPPPRVPDPYERPFEATLRRQAQERNLAEHLRRERRKRPAPNTPPRHPSPILRDPPRPRLRSNKRPRVPIDPPAHRPQSIPPQTDPLRPQLRGNKRPRVTVDPPIEPRQSSERKKDPEPDRPRRGASRTKPLPPMPYFHPARTARARYYLPSPISITDQRHRRAASQGHCEPATPSTTCAPVYLPPHVAGAPLILPRQSIVPTPPPPYPAAQAPIYPPNFPFRLPTSQGLFTWTPYTQAPPPPPPPPPYEPHVPPRYPAAGDLDPFSPILIWPPPERVRSIQLAPWLSASSMERDLQPSIVWDLAQWPMSAMCRTERDILVSADDVFDLPATHPPVRRMVIRCDHLDYFGAVWPWGPIIVESASGVTVGEVFKAIFEYFQRQLTNAEANLVRSRSDVSYRKMARTWRDRCCFRSPGTVEYERRQGLKRIDCLGKRHMFWGVWISFNHDRQSWGAHLGLTNRR